MASHFRLGKCHIITNGVMTGTNVLTSSTVHILNLDNIFLQANVTGTPNGSISIQVSGDHVEDQEGNVLVAGNWIEVVALPVVGAAVNFGEDLNQLGAPWLRIQYTNTSSTGVINAFVSGKGLM